MLISTKGRYALRVMIDLAEHVGGGYIPLHDIAARQEISEKYLESILSVLSKARYLEGLRGKGGGYRLTRPPETYTVGSILRLTEGSLAPVDCLKQPDNICPRAASCRTLAMWREFGELTDRFFDGKTLADLAASPDGGDFVI